MAKLSGTLASGALFTVELQHPCTACGRYLSTAITAHGPGKDGAFFCSARESLDLSKVCVSIFVQRKPGGNRWRAATAAERSEVLRYVFALAEGGPMGGAAFTARYGTTQRGGAK